jgi:pimeloyl-ACP methyl ester carboxylesterase
VAGGWAFLLIHGAQMDGAGWAAVQPLLAAPSFAVDLPGRPASRLPELVPSESQKLAYALEDLSSLDAERVVVVGHSAAGGILPGLFAAGTKVRHSVYVTCLVAPPGRTTHHAVPPLLRIGLSVYRRWCMARGRTHTAVIGSGPVRRRIALLLLNAVPRSERADLLGHFWPEPNSELDLVAPASLSPGPCTVVLCLRDRVIGLRSQIAALRHLGPGVRAVAIDADHFPAMSRPTELAAVLNDVLAMARSQEAASDLRRR